MPAPGLRGIPLFLIFCLLGRGGYSQGQKAHESAGKIQPVLGCKAYCCGFLEGRNLSPKLSKSICSQKERAGERRGQDKGVSGKKEHATVHIRQHPMAAAVSGARKWPGDQGWKGCMQSTIGWYFILWLQS